MGNPSKSQGTPVTGGETNKPGNFSIPFLAMIRFTPSLLNAL
jgi:hypothetical protein